MKVDRLISIIMLLLEKERIGARELSEQFEVSPRTIYRDIDAINLAGIPVRSVSGVGGGFEIMPAYKLEKKVFSAADLSAILTGLSGLSGMLRGAELTNALAKVRSLIPADRSGDIELRANQIRIDLSPWAGNRNTQPYLERIKTALQTSRLLRFAYADQHGSETARTVEPYQLVLKGSHWYLQGYCRMRQDYRLFKISRIAALQMQDETFAPRAYQEPLLDFSEALEAVQTEILIRIHRSVMDQVLDFCDYGHFTSDGNEHYIVRFPFVENDYYYNILFGLGEFCECLEPAHVRAEMKRRIENIARLYA